MSITPYEQAIVDETLACYELSDEQRVSTQKLIEADERAHSGRWDPYHVTHRIAAAAARSTK